MLTVMSNCSSVYLYDLCLIDTSLKTLNQGKQILKNREKQCESLEKQNKIFKIKLYQLVKNFKKANYFSKVNLNPEIVYTELPKSFQLSTYREVTVIITALCFSPSVLLKYECQLIFSRGPSTHF